MKNKIIGIGILLSLSNSTFAYTYPEEVTDFPESNPASKSAGCTNPITLKETNISSRKWGSVLGKLQLRYSSNCKGAWVKFIGYQEQEIKLGVKSPNGGHAWNGYSSYGNFSDFGQIAWSPFVTVKPGELVEGYGSINLYGNDGMANGDLGKVKIPSSSESSSTFSLTKGNYAINAYSPKNNRNVNMWKYSRTDKDQKWVKDGELIKRLSSNYCLNTPHRSNGGNVFLWKCNQNDSDQKWTFSWRDGDTTNIALGNSGYCLNAYNPSNYSNLNIWRCDPNDPDQRFLIK